MPALAKNPWQVLVQKPWLISIILAGLLVIIAGAAVIGISLDRGGEELEIIDAGPPAPEIFVDIGGAVIKPGIFRFPPESRVNDLLVAAGGLAADADRDWVSQNLNLARKLTDGEKIYIPFQGKTVEDSSSLRKGESSLININTASLAELDTLWGVGPVTAQKIIDNRPYAKIEDLLDKKIIKSNVYEAIKDQVSVL